MNFTCPYCNSETISFLDKALEVRHAEPQKCAKCRGEWTVSRWKFLWLFIAFVIVLSPSLVLKLVSVVVYAIGIIFFAPIKRIYN